MGYGAGTTACSFPASDGSGSRRRIGAAAVEQTTTRESTRHAPGLAKASFAARHDPHASREKHSLRWLAPAATGTTR